jgi:excisionase family DNA binding protein
MTARQAADILGAHENTVRAMVNGNEIGWVRLGSDKRIPAEALTAYLSGWRDNVASVPVARAPRLAPAPRRPRPPARASAAAAPAVPAPPPVMVTVGQMRKGR